MFLFPFKYELDESELQVRVGRWIVRRLAYRDIKDISLPERNWVHWHFGVIEKWVNFSLSKCIIIHRNDTFLGLKKVFIINPPDRNRFTSQLRTKLERKSVGGQG